MKVKGTIEIDPVTKTITVKLENGSYCNDHYPIGIQRFLEVEIECLQEQTDKTI